MSKRFLTASAYAAITVHGGTLLLFSRKDRNDIIRAAAVDAGEMWQAKFLPLRFTKYVVRYPFGYGQKSINWITAKVRHSKDPGIKARWNGFLRYNFNGWDPWQPGLTVPLPLYQRWLRENPGQYKTKNQGRSIQLQESKRAYEDIRRWAKRLGNTFARLLDSEGKIQPLVDSGALRAIAGDSKPKATSTTFSFSLKVPVPFPGPRNPVVPRIIQTVPGWESERVGTQMAETIASVIAGSSESFSRSRGGGVNRGYKLAGAQSRIPEATIGRSVE